MQIPKNHPIGENVNIKFRNAKGNIAFFITKFRFLLLKILYLHLFI